ncbi:MAG TPA: hypothetical protein VND93_32645 [Myxococcales bacterium]|nr:hypothetical protein [Myxococcales bacterium]
MRRWCFILGLIALGAEAHDGPPYPILVDRQTRHGRMSVWADPDLGTGTFWIYLEPAANAPLVNGVTVTVQRPGRQAQSCAGRLVHQAKDEQRFQCEVQFDELGTWRAHIQLPGEEVEQDVEVTPPGQGPVLDFILYLFPFVAVGALFILAMVRRRRGR